MAFEAHRLYPAAGRVVHEAIRATRARGQIRHLRIAQACAAATEGGNQEGNSDSLA